jgi:hypothetical protein
MIIKSNNKLVPAISYLHSAPQGTDININHFRLEQVGRLKVSSKVSSIMVVIVMRSCRFVSYTFLLSFFLLQRAPRIAVRSPTCVEFLLPPRRKTPIANAQFLPLICHKFVKSNYSVFCPKNKFQGHPLFSVVWLLLVVAVPTT